MKVKIYGTTHRDIRNLKYAPTVDITGSSIPINEFTVEIKTNNSPDWFVGLYAYLYTDEGVYVCGYRISSARRVDDFFVEIVAQSRISDFDKIILPAVFYDNRPLNNVFRDCGLYSFTSSAESVTGYCPQQSARERLQWLCTIYGYWIEDFYSGLRAIRYGDRLFSYSADSVYYLPHLERQRAYVKVSATVYRYEERTPTESDKWVYVNGHYYVETAETIESGSADPEARTINFDGITLINSSNISGLLSRTIGYYSNPSVLTADVKAKESERLIEPGDEANVYYRENQRYRGTVESVSFSTGGDALKASLSLIQPTSVPVYQTIISLQTKRHGRVVAIDTMTFYLPSGNFSINLEDRAVTEKGITYYYEPDNRVFAARIVAGTNRFVVQYHLARIDGIDVNSSDIYLAADRGKYPRKFVENVDKARKGYVDARRIFSELGIDYEELTDKTYYELYQMALDAYNDMPDSEEKVRIFEALFDSDLIWVVDGGTWFTNQEVAWAFDENGELRFPAYFANTLAKARRGEQDALDVFAKLGLSKSDIDSMSDDEIYEVFRDSYIDWSQGGFGDDELYIFSRVGVSNPSDLSDDELYDKWVEAFGVCGDSDSAYHIFERMGYSKEDIDGMTEQEKLDLWDTAFNLFVDEDRENISDYFFDSFANRKSLAKYIDAKQISIRYNGVYTAETAFSEVFANPTPRLAERTFRANGHYFKDDSIEGYNRITVDVDKNDWMRDVVINQEGEFEPEQPYEAYSQVNIDLPFYTEKKLVVGERVRKGQPVKLYSVGDDLFEIDCEWNEVDDDHIYYTMPIYKNGEFVCYLVENCNLISDNVDVVDVIQDSVIFKQGKQDIILYKNHTGGDYRDIQICYGKITEGEIVHNNAKKVSVSDCQTKVSSIIEYSSVIQCVLCAVNGRPAIITHGQEEVGDWMYARIIVLYLDNMGVVTYSMNDYVDVSPLQSLNLGAHFICTAEQIGDEVYFAAQLHKAEEVEGEIVHTYEYKMLRFSTDTFSPVLDLTDFLNNSGYVWGFNIKRVGDSFKLLTLMPKDEYEESIIYGENCIHLIDFDGGEWIDKGEFAIGDYEAVFDFVEHNGELYAANASVSANATGQWHEEYPYYSPLRQTDGTYKIVEKQIKRYE